MTDLLAQATPADSLAPWASLIKDLGINGAMLIAAGYVIWRFIRWAEPKVNDLLAWHKGLLDETIKNQRDIKDRQERHSDQFDTVVLKLADIHEDVRRVHERACRYPSAQREVT